MSNPTIQTSDLENTFNALKRGRAPSIPQNVSQGRSSAPLARQNYATTTSVNTGGWGAGVNNMFRFASSSNGIIYGQPQFFSPVHTPINWQIPSKRLEESQWARFFYKNEPKVASSIDFYSYFPINDYEHECKDRKIKKYFDKLKKRLDIVKWLRLISHEVHLLGDCFPFIEISCPVCGGLGRVGDQVCDHEGGTVRRIIILNPDYVEVFTSPFNPEPVIALKPDEELINMVQRKTPGYESLTPEVIKLISSGQPIRLDNRNVGHLMYGEGGYTRYGTGMVRRLFPILSYKTKLMVAQWIVAERLIVPIKIVKVGSDERPAGPADIAAVQEQLAMTANDPNLTIVTHHAFELDWQGACYSSDTEVLTENGWKKYDDVSKNYDEKIATYNLDKNNIEYQIPQEYHEYEYDGELMRFESKHYDCAVTPNHRMLVSERIWDSNSEKYLHKQWVVSRADSVCENSRFKTTAEWQGEIPHELPYKKEKLLGKLLLDDYLKFIGYYLSEGGLKIDKGVINATHLTQKEDSPCFNDLKESIYKISCKIQESEDTRSQPSFWQFIINDSEFSREMSLNYGKNSFEKRIPRWILSLPKRELSIILNSLMDGDGNVRFSSNGSPRYKYTTASIDLANDVQEIVFKMGYDPKISLDKSTNPNVHDKYIVYWSESIRDCDYRSVKDRNIGRIKYNGKVWCFTVPNGFFITRRNGKISIHGNSGKVLTLSNEFELINQEILDGLMINNALLNGEGPNFSSAAVGIEAMIQRLDSFRKSLSSWVEEFIYLPEAKRQGFIDEDRDERDEDDDEDDIEYIYPRIKWNSMHLRDQQQYRQFVMQLYEKGLLSAQTVLEAFDFEPDMEIERKRYDAVQLMALGQGAGQPGAAGGAGGGGLPGLDMGGGFGGAPEGAPPMGDLGGAGGEAPIGATPEGGAPPALKSSSVSLDVADPSQFGGKVLKEKTRNKILHDQKKVFDEKQKSMSPQSSGGQTRDEKGRVIFTKPERELLDGLIRYQKDGIINYKIYPQYRVSFGSTEYPIDFAIPHLKIGIEADGELFHSSPKQISRDKERDMKLNQAGWTILRFTDHEIEKKPSSVMSAIVKTIMQKEMAIKNIKVKED